MDALDDHEHSVGGPRHSIAHGCSHEQCKRSLCDDQMRQNLVFNRSHGPGVLNGNASCSTASGAAQWQGELLEMDAQQLCMLRFVVAAPMLLLRTVLRRVLRPTTGAATGAAAALRLVEPARALPALAAATGAATDDRTTPRVA